MFPPSPLPHRDKKDAPRRQNARTAKHGGRDGVTKQTREVPSKRVQRHRGGVSEFNVIEKWASSNREREERWTRKANKIGSYGRYNDFTVGKLSKSG